MVVVADRKKPHFINSDRRMSRLATWDGMALPLDSLSEPHSA